MHTAEYHREQFNTYLKDKLISKKPENLYEPMSYILKLGGKRLRPVLALMAAEAFGEKEPNALDAALAVEIFHNFSLVHDDIMDSAPLRRKQPTVHKKWDTNTAILSGDAMLIYAYQCLEVYPAELFSRMVKLFSHTAMQVCEGQQYDMDFEARETVLLEEYLEMITDKTAVLLGASLQMGAMVAGAGNKDQLALYEFGKNLGIAFQLQDDYLDAFGDPATFGKQLGGDIIENKKTYLYIRALELASETARKDLGDLYSIRPSNPGHKIERVKELFAESGAVEQLQESIARYTSLAFETLDSSAISDLAKTKLREFGSDLMKRQL